MKYTSHQKVPKIFRVLFSLIILAIPLLLSACGLSEEEKARIIEQAVTQTAASWTHTPSATFTETSIPETFTPTITLTPTLTLTPTITATPTFSFPSATVNKQAHCRYGPSVAFLHAADLYPGDTGLVTGRYEYSSWLFVKFDKLDYTCWVAPSVVDVVGDINTVFYQPIEEYLQNVGYNQFGPPQNINATRNGNDVTITWDQVVMGGDKDRGYLIIAFVCQNGSYLWWTAALPTQWDTSYTVTDEPGCPAPSEGVIYTVEKHGFAKPATIPWPP